MVGLVLSLVLCQCAGVEPSSPQIIVAGHNNPNISIVDLGSGQIVWQIPMERNGKEKEQCNSMVLVGDGKYLAYTTQLGAKVVSIETKELITELMLEDTESSEAHSLCLRDDGGISIFVAGTPARVVELSADFEVIASLEFDAIKASKHGQFRQAIMAKNGNYLIPLFGNNSVLELSRQGEKVKEHLVGGSAFSIRECANGNFLLGMGGQCSVVEYNPSTESIVREFTGFEELEYLYASQVEEIGLGRIMLSNWSGHNKKELTRPAPQLVEVDNDFNVVWAWESETVDISMVSAFVYSDTAIVK